MKKAEKATQRHPKVGTIVRVSQGHGNPDVDYRVVAVSGEGQGMEYTLKGGNETFSIYAGLCQVQVKKTMESLRDLKKSNAQIGLNKPARRG